MLSTHKKAQLLRLQSEIKKLQSEATQLEKSGYFQEREIRKVLGYASSDEIIFDFVPNRDTENLKKKVKD